MDEDKEDSIEEVRQSGETRGDKPSQENAREDKESESDSENATAFEQEEATRLNNGSTTTAAHSKNIESSGDEGDVHAKNISRERVILSSEDDSHHHVWRPKEQPNLPSLRNRKSTHSGNTNPLVDRSLQRMSIFVRQQQLLDRVQATQAVLKETTDDILGSPETKKPYTFKEAASRIISDQRKHKNRLSDNITQYLAREGDKQPSMEPQPPTSPGFPMWHPNRRLYKRQSSHGMLGAIRVEEWQKLSES